MTSTMKTKNVLFMLRRNTRVVCDRTEGERGRKKNVFSIYDRRKLTPLDVGIIHQFFLDFLYNNEYDYQI